MKELNEPTHIDRVINIISTLIDNEVEITQDYLENLRVGFNIKLEVQMEQLRDKIEKKHTKEDVIEAYKFESQEYLDVTQKDGFDKKIKQSQLKQRAEQYYERTHGKK